MNHLQQIAAKLPEYGLDAMLLTSEPGEFYAVGFHGEGAVLVTTEECLYCTDSRYIEAAEAQVAGARVLQTGRDRTQGALIREAVEAQGIRRLGFEERRLSVAAWTAWKEILPAELVPAQALPDGLRAAKDPEEQAQMLRAQEITDRASPSWRLPPGSSTRCSAWGRSGCPLTPLWRRGLTAASHMPCQVAGMWRRGTSSPWISAASAAATAPT